MADAIAPPLTLEQLLAIDDASLAPAEVRQLLAEIDRWCHRNNVSETAFGRMACDFGGWVGLMRLRGSCRTRMAALARALLDRYRAGVPAADQTPLQHATRAALFQIRAPAPRRSRYAVRVKLAAERTARPESNTPVRRVEVGPAAIRQTLAAICQTAADEARRAGASRAIAATTSSVLFASRLTLDRPAATTAPAFAGDRRAPAWSREPCPVCGTRGDLGCAHQRPFEEFR